MSDPTTVMVLPEFKAPWDGATYTHVAVVVSRYISEQYQRAMVLVLPSGEPLHTVTTNLEAYGIMPAGKETYMVRDYAEGEGVADELVKRGVLRLTGSTHMLDHGSRCVEAKLTPAAAAGLNLAAAIDADRSPEKFSLDVGQDDTSLRDRLLCIKCDRTPDDLIEYSKEYTGEELDPRDYVLANEGTLNRTNGHFLCTACYIKMGSPSAPGGWRAP